ncbi:hypothetical protein [Pseudoalteromonas luteoviolacea]|uniref:Uncharacterized protein n=1 Tax=Pseudoalteromonas luteoviolacea S4054 TaxID=1129367 RepID=A0A0F6AIH4_9GAMM|nr:hypothetical protein [Pseudoalteromonas luteoviolacea]AOT09514.1 hypothetical protein S4054249_17435 [Pseudoalteromonas luteoviolacea]AOT14426.1 hypothetical protein S40542_17405 [Pseudoalteromonas luteoviolacea]AOT19342.1 hypothetical protein S4054_17410 [Pseudoalteromonas luteoviolacea]KKE85731.1 hypothetical protein N479_24895 [Pseudoalteromonas luteoviolacea S4054]KZN65315.1 hypothetical protein N481_02670 [Pseudoalteromonas luteoviolacea S4047-1]
MKNKSVVDNESVCVRNKPANQCHSIQKGAPAVALWKTWGLRLIFAAMVIVLGSKQLSYILEGASEWSRWRGLGHSMLFALALFAIGGVFRPLTFLPIMLYEIVWKLVWLIVVALPPFLAGQDVPNIVNAKASIIGIVVLIVLIPWRYVWWKYFSQPIEPWRRKKRLK